ncbi:PAS domain S-box protein [Syntrophotalea carbinolica]|nr:PAS domain S-box protein [Syntrophotalea carbinolica]
MERIEGREQEVTEILDRIRLRLGRLGISSGARQAIGDDAQLCIDSLRDALGVVARLLPSTCQDLEGLQQLVDSLAVVGAVGRPEAAELGMNNGFADAADRFQELEREQLQCIFSATTNLVMVSDSRGMVTHLNPAAEQFFSECAWRSVPFWQLLALSGSGLDEVLAAYTPDSHHEIYLSWAGQWFNLRLVPFAPHADVPSGYILILNDITWLVDSRQHLERLVAERTRALTNSEKMLRLIFQSVGNGILLLSDDYRIVKANQRAGQIHGCSADELIGKDLRDLTDNHGRWTLTSCVAALGGETSMSAEIQVRRTDGSMLPTSFMVTSVAIDGRHFWSIIVRDISRQKALEERLRMEKQQVEEMNVTLRNVMKSVDGDRKEFENTLARRIRSHLLPAIDRIEGESSENIRASYLDLVREQLIGLTSGSASEIDANLLKLSKTEMRICQFIQAGCSTKDICEAMNLAFETVQTHRKNIRRKLGLRGKNVNLHSYLIGRRSLTVDQDA